MSSLLRKQGTIAGEDVKNLSDHDLVVMKTELQSQLAARRGEIEEARAQCKGGILPGQEWHDYQAWRNKTTALYNMIEKEVVRRKGTRAEDNNQSRRLTQVAELAALLLADNILDGDAGMNIESAAADAVRVSRLAFDAVWREINKEGS